MSCCVFQLGQSPLIFVPGERLLHRQSGTYTLRLVSGLDTQENLLYLKLCGYISSAWAADGQQLGPSSQYLWAKLPLGLCCCWTPWSGLFHNLGGSQGHLVDLTQSWWYCLLSVYRLFIGLSGPWDFWQWHLTDFCRTHYLIVEGKLAFPPVSILRKSQTQVSVVPRAALPPGHFATSRQPRSLSHKARLCWEAWGHAHGMVCWWCLSWVLTCETSRAGLVKKHAHSSAELTMGRKSCSKEGSLLEQIQLKIWANILFQ